MASDVEAQEIRVQLAELSEHILRRLSMLLARAREHSASSYADVEATARDMTDVQRQLMARLGEPVSRREELPLLMSLMRVQDRALSVIEQLERLPFNRAPLSLAVEQSRSSQSGPPTRPAASMKRETPGHSEFAPWPEETLADIFPVGPSPHSPAPTAYVPDAARPDRSAAPYAPPAAGRLNTRPSAGQPIAAVGKPVRSTGGTGARPEQRQARPRPVEAPAAPPIAPDSGGAPLADRAPQARPAPSVEIEQAPAEKTAREPSNKGSSGALVPILARASRLWDVGLLRQVPRVMLSSIFIVLGLVFAVLIGRLFLVVLDELGSRRSAPEPVISTERLPPETTTPTPVTEFGGRPGRVLPPTGEAFVVILTTHPDAASAQRQFSELRQQFPTSFAGLSADVQPIEGAGGFRYRLALAPPLARERALSLCAEVKAAGFAACWLRRLQR